MPVPAITESVDIRAPLDLVFDAVTDPRRAGEWNPNIIDLSRPEPLPVQPGTAWTQTANVMGRPMRLHCRIVEFEPPAYGRLMVSGDQQATIVTTCQSGPGGTRVTQTIDFAPPSGIFGALAAQFAGPMLQRELQRTMARLRAVLEHEGNNAGGTWTT